MSQMSFLLVPKINFEVISVRLSSGKPGVWPPLPEVGQTRGRCCSIAALLGGGARSAHARSAPRCWCLAGLSADCPRSQCRPLWGAARAGPHNQRLLDGGSRSTPQLVAGASLILCSGRSHRRHVSPLSLWGRLLDCSSNARHAWSGELPTMHGLRAPFLSVHRNCMLGRPFGPLRGRCTKHANTASLRASPI